MLCSILISSALTLSPATHNRYHSVQQFDNAIRVSDRVLDRSICGDIERVQAPSKLDLAAAQTPEQKQAVINAALARQVANRTAVVNHCKLRLRSENLAENECNLHEDDAK